VGASEYAPDLPDEVKRGGFMITKSRAKARAPPPDSTTPPQVQQPSQAAAQEAAADCAPARAALQVGEGRKAFDAAVAAIKKWQHLQLGEPARQRLRLGSPVSGLAAAGGQA
jgi:hypothetical protein